jgi:hypothetical protein
LSEEDSRKEFVNITSVYCVRNDSPQGPAELGGGVGEEGVIG